MVRMTPVQIAVMIGDREKIVATIDGKLDFWDADEFRGWQETQKRESSKCVASI